MALSHETHSMLQEPSDRLGIDWSWAIRALILLGFIIMYCKVLWRLIHKDSKQASRYSPTELLRMRKQVPAAQGSLRIVNLERHCPQASPAYMRHSQDGRYDGYGQESFAARMSAPHQSVYASSYAPNSYRGMHQPSSALPVYYSGPTTPHTPTWPQYWTSTFGPGHRPVVTGAPYVPSGAPATSRTPPGVTVGNPCLSERRNFPNPRVNPAELCSAQEPQSEVPKDLMSTIRQLVSLISPGTNGGVVDSCSRVVPGVREPENPHIIACREAGVSSGTSKAKIEESTAASSPRQNSPTMQDEQKHRNLASWITNHHPAPIQMVTREEAVVVGTGIANEGNNAIDLKYASNEKLPRMSLTRVPEKESVTDVPPPPQNRKISPEVTAALKLPVEAIEEPENLLLQLVINFKFLQRKPAGQSTRCSLPALQQLAGGGATLTKEEMPAAVNKEARAVLRGSRVFKRKEIFDELLTLLQTHGAVLEPATVREMATTAEQCGEWDKAIEAISNMRVSSIGEKKSSSIGEKKSTSSLEPKLEKCGLSVDAPEFTPIYTVTSSGTEERGHYRKVRRQRK